jgi:hypothetical protein
MLSGMPIQTTTDHGSEVTEVFGLANALRCEYWVLKAMLTTETMKGNVLA